MEEWNNEKLAKAVRDLQVRVEQLEESPAIRDAFDKTIKETVAEFGVQKAALRAQISSLRVQLTEANKKNSELRASLELIRRAVKG